MWARKVGLSLGFLPSSPSPFLHPQDIWWEGRSMDGVGGQPGTIAMGTCAGTAVRRLRGGGPQKTQLKEAGGRGGDQS